MTSGLNRTLSSWKGRESRWVRRGSAKKGCLIALVVFLVLVAGGVTVVAVKYKDWMASGAVALTTRMVNESDMPADQKDRVIAKVKSVTDDYRNGKITFAQLGKVFEQIAEGPIFPLGLTSVIQTQYVEKSTLSKEEKDAGERTMQRLARAIAEKKVKLDDFKSVVAPISDPAASHGNQFRLKPVAQVKPEEIRAMLADAKKRADDAQIPDEAYTVNIADALDEAVNKALGK